MTRHLAALSAALVLTACSATNYEPPRTPTVPKANVVALSLSDDFAFTKVSPFFYDPRDVQSSKPSVSPMVNFERQRTIYGAVNNTDRAERYGHYYNVYWRSNRTADLTLRFEYRQQNLGSHVQAQEQYYPAANGKFESKFTVIGDAFAEDGKVTSWRLLLLENGRAVAVKQSYLWN